MFRNCHVYYLIQFIDVYMILIQPKIIVIKINNAWLLHWCATFFFFIVVLELQNAIEWCESMFHEVNDDHYSVESKCVHFV